MGDHCESCKKFCKCFIMVGDERGESLSSATRGASASIGNVDGLISTSGKGQLNNVSGCKVKRLTMAANIQELGSSLL
jgi:hypothetical protein